MHCLKIMVGSYLVLHYEDGIVYGYEIVYRGLEQLRVDGKYWGSNGASSGALCKMTFSKNVRKETILAETDAGVYKIDKKNVTETEFKKYMQDEFYSKEEVKFVQYK